MILSCLCPLFFFDCFVLHHNWKKYETLHLQNAPHFFATFVCVLFSGSQSVYNTPSLIILSMHIPLDCILSSPQLKTHDHQCYLWACFEHPGRCLEGKMAARDHWPVGELLLQSTVETQPNEWFSKLAPLSFFLPFPHSDMTPTSVVSIGR